MTTPVFLAVSLAAFVSSTSAGTLSELSFRVLEKWVLANKQTLDKLKFPVNNNAPDGLVAFNALASVVPSKIDKPTDRMTLAISISTSESVLEQRVNAWGDLFKDKKIWRVTVTVRMHMGGHAGNWGAYTTVAEGDVESAKATKVTPDDTGVDKNDPKFPKFVEVLAKELPVAFKKYLDEQIPADSPLVGQVKEEIKNEKAKNQKS